MKGNCATMGGGLGDTSDVRGADLRLGWYSDVNRPDRGYPGASPSEDTSLSYDVRGDALWA